MEAGDTVNGLAQEFGIDAETIVLANDLGSEDQLAVGQELTILPVSGVLHVVQEGDTLDGIANMYATGVAKVAEFNGLTDPDQLKVGRQLVVPGGRVSSRSLLASRSGGRSGPLKPATYVVQPGDSLVGISERFGIDVETLLWTNDVSDPDTIVPGIELVVLPVNGVLYTVQPGESVVTIAEQFGLDPEEVMMANGVDDPLALQVGAKLLLPGGTPVREEPAATPESTPTPAPEPVAAVAEPEPVAAPSPAPAQPAPEPTAEPATAAQAEPEPAAPAPSGGQSIVNVASEYLGYPYVWGGTSPSVGFDCTGFVYWVTNKRLGLPIPRDLWGQLGSGTRVSRAQVQTGDLVFFQNTYQAGLSHVGIALDNDRFIHAASERYGVMVSNLNDAYWSARWYGATRP
ncbi:MAG: LysM peptidoglycan-binding domain-containing protein [Chloroflexota bacterium]